MKKPKWVLITCCQGQPFYKFYHNIVCVSVGLMFNYFKKKNYGTMRFSVKQIFDTDKEYKIWSETRLGKERRSI